MGKSITKPARFACLPPAALPFCLPRCPAAIACRYRLPPACPACRLKPCRLPLSCRLPCRYAFQPACRFAAACLLAHNGPLERPKKSPRG